MLRATPGSSDKDDSVHKIRARLEDNSALIGIVGFGYVGLPLACLLASCYRVVVFDINAGRQDEFRSGLDLSPETPDKTKPLNPTLSFYRDAAALRESCRPEGHLQARGMPASLARRCGASKQQRLKEIMCRSACAS
jgi:hypothetical protein